MTAIIKTAGLSKRYGDLAALDGLSLEISSGTVTGLIGPNGAGKTTFLRSLLGLNQSSGSIDVLGMDPRGSRSQLQEQVCFIADTAVLPTWMKVGQLIDYVAGVHPGFDRAAALQQLEQTEVQLGRRVKELSKGMVVQLHLAMVMSIDARLLILDEPTLGLDVIFRKRFFEQLLNDYYDDERTIIISTHQVEEVEHILTHVIFMAQGRIILHESVDALTERFVELHCVGNAVTAARELQPLGERSILGGKALIFEDGDLEVLQALGELRSPSIADLFVAKVSKGG
jgi:ABC-2 type transport system ATP-binding protein